MATHNHLAFTFGILGNIISFLVFLAPLPTFYRIYKRKSTEDFQSVPYVVALFSCVLWLYYASLKTEVVLLLTINSFGCLMEIIYIFMYIIYAPREARYLTVKLLLAIVGFFALIFFVTQFALDSSLHVTVVGWICVSVAVIVFAAPLSIVAQVIRTRSVEFMPFNLSFFLTLSAIMWFAYGAFLKDICIAIPNVLGFVLGLVQMVLYAIYRNGGEERPVGNKEHAPEPMRNVVVVSPLAMGAGEVFPISTIDDAKEEGKNDGAEDKEIKNAQDIECPV